SYGGEPAIGLDKVKGLARIIDVMGEHHPKTLTALGGDMALSARLTDMYLDGKFRKSRSQQAIREVVRALKNMDEDDQRSRDFLKDELDWRRLQPFAETPDQPPDLVKMCGQLTTLLLSVDATDLSEQEQRALSRTRAVLHEVLSQAGLSRAL